MSTQRSGRSVAASFSDRRGFLSALGSTAAAVGLAGCASPLSHTLSGRSRPVSILAAGSLQHALADGLRDAVAPPIEIEAHGSVTAARLVATGRRDPDILALADTILFDRLLDATWHVEFATTALVVAHADSPGGRRVASARPWFRPVLRDRASLGRTDPDLDPLGYRTRIALELGASVYDRPDFPRALLAASQVHPETSLLSRLGTDTLDAAVVYQNMARGRGFPFRGLPAAIDLSDPSRADAYATASYRLPDGTTVPGRPISFGAQARRRDDSVVAVFDSLVDGSYLRAYGFDLPAEFPRIQGTPPAEFRA